MSTKELSKHLRDKVVDRHRSGDGYKKIFQRPSISLEAQWRQSLGSGRCMVPPSPDQAITPNWMTKQGGDWSERPPRDQWQLWKSYRPLWQRLVTGCTWQQYSKHSTNLACMLGWQEGSHYSKKPNLSPISDNKKPTPEIPLPCGKKFCGLTKPKWNFLASMLNATFCANPTQHITQSTPSLL